MKVGIISNGSGAIYREAALAFKDRFVDTYVGNENILCDDLDTCDMFVVIGNYFRNYHAERAGPVKEPEDLSQFLVYHRDADLIHASGLSLPNARSIALTAEGCEVFRSVMITAQRPYGGDSF